MAIWLAVGLVLLSGGDRPAIWRARACRDLWRVYREGALVRAGELAILFGLASAIMVLGLLDDRYRLGPMLRLAVQVALAIVFVAYGRSRDDVPGRGLATKLGMGTITVLWIVGLTNSFNFLDNMDGLAASVGLIAALLFAGAQVAVEGLFVPAVLLALAGALGGFLVHNRPPARLFMGDAGSNFLGFLLGTLTVAGTFTRAGLFGLRRASPRCW